MLQRNFEYNKNDFNSFKIIPKHVFKHTLQLQED